MGWDGVGAERVELWAGARGCTEEGAGITHARARRRENDGVCVELSRERNTALSTRATNGPCRPCWWQKGREEQVERNGREKVTGGERRLTMMLNFEVTRKMTAG
jgi:hypothetical protein